MTVSHLKWKESKWLVKVTVSCIDRESMETQITSGQKTVRSKRVRSLVKTDHYFAFFIVNYCFFFFITIYIK